MRKFEVLSARRRGQNTPIIEVWEQPLFRYLIAKAYHWWDSFSEPLMRRISDWHRKRFEKDDTFVPLLNRRDIRCYILKYRHRHVVAIVPLSPEHYKALTGKTLEGEPTSVSEG